MPRRCRAHLKGAVAAAGTALLGGLRTGRAGAQAGPVEVAQDLGDGTAQNWLVYPDGRRVPVGCRYDLATGECVAPGATEEIPAPASALPQVSGKVRVWQNDLVDAWKLLQPLAAERFPNLTVEVEAVPRQQNQTYEAAIIANLAAGTAPDTFGTDTVPAFMGPYVELGAILPITSYFNTLPNLQQVFGWARAKATIGGQVWGIPTYGAFEAIGANLKVMERAGLRTLPTTWDEFLDQAGRLRTALADRRPTEAGGTKPGALQKPPPPLMINFPGNAGSLFNSLRAAFLGRDGVNEILYGNGRWDSADMIDLAQTAVDLQRQGIIPAQPIDDHFIGFSNFPQGNAAWWPNGSWSVLGWETTRRNNPGEFDYAFFGLPSRRGTRGPQFVGRIVGGMLFNKNTRVLDAAVTLGDFLISKPALKIWYTGDTGEFPGPVIPVQPAEFGLSPGLTSILAIIVTAGDLPDNIEEMASGTFREFELQQMGDLLNGKIGPRDYCIQVQRIWEQEKAAGKLPTQRR